MEDFTQRTAPGLLLPPTGEHFRRHVHEADGAVSVVGDHRITDRAKRGREPFAAFPNHHLRPVFVQGHLDGDLELPVPEGLQDISERPCSLGTLESGPIGVGREIYHWDIESLPDDFRRLDAVQVLAQKNVHQDQVGRRLAGLLNRLSPARRPGRHRIAHPLQSSLQIQGHQALILYDDHAGCAHGLPPEAFAAFSRRENCSGKNSFAQTGQIPWLNSASE